MSTLVRLRDLAGCRVVLRDAQEEQRAPGVIADLERVRQEAEDALWDGGPCALGLAMTGSSLVVRRASPPRPDVSESAFNDAINDGEVDFDVYEDARVAWSAEMIAEWKGAIRRFQRSDLLAWRGQPRRQPRNMHEIDWASIGMSPPDRIWTAGETLSQPDRVNPEAWIPRATRDAIVFGTGRVPSSAVVSQQNYEALQRRLDAQPINKRLRRELGHRTGVDHQIEACASVRVSLREGRPESEVASARQRLEMAIERLRPIVGAGLNDVFGDGREWTRSLVPAEPRTAEPGDSDGIEVRLRSYANFVTPWVGVIDPT